MNAPGATKFEFWPDVASGYAHRVDVMLGTWVGIMSLLVLPALFALLFFAVKYRRGSDANRAGPVDRNWKLEAAWASIPFAAALVFFVWAAHSYVELKTPVSGAREIHVVGRQWMWKVEHPGGQGEINALHIPVGEPIQLTMISTDVIHSFFVPALRIKQDLLPGRYTYMWFRADKPGTYRLFCAEFCGTEHSRMTGEVVALPPGEFQRWLENSAADEELARQGRQLFSRLGCSGCHGSDGPVRAPSLAGIYRRPVPLASGEVVIADDRYLRDSILYPARQVVAGYRPKMPSFAGKVSEEEMIRLIEYLKTVEAQEGTRR